MRLIACQVIAGENVSFVKVVPFLANIMSSKVIRDEDFVQNADDLPLLVSVMQEQASLGHVSPCSYLTSTLNVHANTFDLPHAPEPSPSPTFITALDMEHGGTAQKPSKIPTGKLFNETDVKFIKEAYTPLPNNLHPNLLLNATIRNCTAVGRGLMSELAQNSLSHAFLLDGFWSMYYELFMASFPRHSKQETMKLHQYTADAAIVFDRMSLAFAYLFLSIPHTLKDDFFDWYRDITSQYIFIALHRAFPLSRNQFESTKYKSWIWGTITYWITGNAHCLKSCQISWENWPLGLSEIDTELNAFLVDDDDTPITKNSTSEYAILRRFQNQLKLEPFKYPLPPIITPGKQGSNPILKRASLSPLVKHILTLNAVTVDYFDGILFGHAQLTKIITSYRSNSMTDEQLAKPIKAAKQSKQKIKKMNQHHDELSKRRQRQMATEKRELLYQTKRLRREYDKWSAPKLVHMVSNYLSSNITK